MSKVSSFLVGAALTSALVTCGVARPAAAQQTTVSPGGIYAAPAFGGGTYRLPYSVAPRFSLSSWFVDLCHRIANWLAGQWRAVVTGYSFYWDGWTWNCRVSMTFQNGVRGGCVIDTGGGYRRF